MSPESVTVRIFNTDSSFIDHFIRNDIVGASVALSALGLPVFVIDDDGFELLGLDDDGIDDDGTDDGIDDEGFELLGIDDEGPDEGINDDGFELLGTVDEGIDDEGTDDGIDDEGTDDGIDDEGFELLEIEDVGVFVGPTLQVFTTAVSTCNLVSAGQSAMGIVPSIELLLISRTMSLLSEPESMRILETNKKLKITYILMRLSREY